MKGLIAAGGHATRLRPITNSINKHLIRLANRPMIYYPINKLARAGIKDIAVVINEGDKEIQKAVGDGSHFGVNITYIEQVGGALGVAHVIMTAKDFLGKDPFVFHLGDNVIMEDLTPMIKKFEDEKLNGLLLIAKVPDPQRFGVPEIVGGKIKRVIEKPENPPSQFAVTGIYLYDYHIFEALLNIKPSKQRGEYEISDVHTWLIDQGYNIGYMKVAGMWKDTGKPYDLIEANQLLLNHIESNQAGAYVEEGVILQGKAEIGKGTSITGRTTIRGPVTIGKGCTIHESYIGPYTSIGNNVEIRETEVENSIVFEESYIKAKTRIVDSIIGSRSKIVLSSENWPSGNRMYIGSSSLVEL